MKETLWFPCFMQSYFSALIVESNQKYRAQQLHRLWQRGGGHKGFRISTAGCWWQRSMEGGVRIRDENNYNPANRRRWANVGLLLTQQYTNIGSTSRVYQIQGILARLRLRKQFPCARQTRVLSTSRVICHIYWDIITGYAWALNSLGIACSRMNLSDEKIYWQIYICHSLDIHTSDIIKFIYHLFPFEWWIQLCK